jgi:ABC-type multidrug transport system ATPase subunit
LRDKIKKEELIYLIVEDITPAQIEQMRSFQGVISITENSEDDLMPNQKGLRLELKSVDQLPSIFDFLFEQKIKLVNFKREEPTLEDAFIELTKRA